MARETKAPGDDALTFEEALARLEEVVVRLERGELSLEESLAAYERGVRLVHAAKSRLDGMQRRLDELLDDGTLQTIKTKTGEAAATPASPAEDQ
jgi:exodeoxyribonuclease VII small subunit